MAHWIALYQFACPNSLDAYVPNSQFVLLSRPYM